MGGFLYQKIAAKIVEDALAVGLCPGDKLPTLEALVVRYGVSAGPVRQALQELRADGKLSSRRGSGYFLTERALSDKEGGALDTLDLNAYIPFMSGGKDTTLRVGLVDGLPAQKRLWGEIVRRFKRARPRVELSLEFFCSGPNMLKHLREGSNPYDILQFDQRELFDAVEEELVVPVPVTFKDAARLPEPLLEALQDGGALRGVPLSASFPTLLLNRKLLAAAGIPVPAELDWRGYVDMARRLAAHKARAGGDFFPSMSSMSPFNYLLGACGECFDRNSRQFDWRRPEVADCFETFAELGARSGATPKGVELELQKAGGFHQAFQDGKIGMLILCDFFLEMFTPGCLRDAAALPFPLGGGLNLCSSNFHVVDKRSPERETAFEFLDFLLGDACVTASRDAGIVHLADQADARLKRALPIIALGKDNYDFIRDSFNRFADAARDGVMEPSAALAALTANYETIRSNGHETKTAV